MAGIYIHIPFCKQACFYCDFHFSTNLNSRQQVLSAIKEEAKLRKDYLGSEPVETIYFGGGTPSLLTAHEINDLLELIYSKFQISSNAEITLEANPDDLKLEKPSELSSAGINRLSIGIQSFDAQFLKYFNRAHSSMDCLTSVHLSRLAGFNNISLDLIYGIPNQRPADFATDVDLLLSQKPEHISAYALTIEPKTVFGKRARDNKLKAVDENVVAEQFNYLLARLEAAGYEHYEVSNFALRGFRSRHNTSYWLGKKYLGIGPSAHSFDGESRQFNIASNTQYCRSIESGVVPFEKEILSRQDRINEYLMTGLRTSWGVDLKKLNDQHAYDLLAEQTERVDSLIKNKMAFIDEGSLKLTQAGLLVADKISSDFFL